MRALVFKRYGGLDQVAFADIPRAAVQPDEILVQVHAAGLNPVDKWQALKERTHLPGKKCSSPRGRRYWHVRYPAREIPRRRSRDDDEYVQRGSSPEAWSR